MKNGPENLKNRDLEGVWELLGATLRQKISQKLSWPILVNFGRARIDQNLAQMGQDGHLEAIWGAFWSILGGLGRDL